ncbi:unnamed protein product [Schistosoma rodhaini]|uniref:Kinase D-interacting substrate of 220 kDa-like SAM domain-containing protein n=1 Tax=Schistosoma rodhaini TaxID=6188 RepID=A0AA85FQA1_9TREM|nr:unnamed protein product [Schistosoma rodhaini]
MHHSHLDSTMTHAHQRFTQQNSIPEYLKHRHRREQSSGSMTSTSRDFSTCRGMNRDTDYPQKQLTRKPRPVSSHTLKEKHASQSRRHSNSRHYPYTNLHDMKEDKRKRIIDKEQMYSRKRLSEIQCTNDSSGSTSNPNRKEFNNHRHFHYVPINTEDAYSHRCEQMQNMLHHLNQKSNMYNNKPTQSMSSTHSQLKKSNLDEVVGLAANDCHLFNYHPYGFNGLTEPPTDWNSTKSQTFSSYNTSTIGGNKLNEQHCQFGLNTLESFQQGCLTSLASMLLCPHTVLPIMVGLFSNFGSSTDYVQKLGEELVYLKQSNPYYYDQAQIGFEFWPGILPLIIVSILGYILGLSLGWQLGFAVAVTATLLYALFFGVIIFGVRIKHWSKTIELAETISRYMRGCNLLFNILFYRSPQAPRVAQPVRLLPISINLSNFSTSTEAAVHLAEKMWISIEQKYGCLPVRLQWASKDVYGDSTKTYRKVCCLPSCIWVFVNVITLLSMATLIAIDNSFKSIENKDGNNNPTPKIDGDVNTLTENLKLFIIVCAVISGLSFLILIAAIIPGILKLIKGRPFQHPIKKPFYPDLESYTDITMDSCYGSSLRKSYPFPNCIETGQCGTERDTNCFTHGGYYNNESRSFLSGSNKLTSTASMAAAAAAAAVTAADRHWRQMENAKYTNHHHHPQQMHERGQFKSKDEFDLQDNLNRINSKMDTNFSDHDDDEEDSSEESKQSDSNEHSSNEDEESSPTDGPLFNSGELLLNGENIPNSNHGTFLKKDLLGNHQSKEYSKSIGNNKRRKTISIERQKNEQLLRQYVLDAYSVLSMLDRRIGGRQTRLIICVNAIARTVENSALSKKLLDFMHLLDHILMKPPTGGKSYDVPLILAPIGSTEGVMNDIPPTVWVPNAVVIIATNISGINANNSRAHTLDSVSLNDPNQMNRMSSALRLSLSNSSGGFNPKIWYSIHQLCHLPIYIENEPLCFRVYDQTNEQPFISPARSASNIQQSHQEKKTEVSQPKSMIDLYVGKHDLLHFNKKRFRHLLTLTAFTGRMVKLDRLFTQRIIYQSSQKSLSYLSALQYFANEPSLNTLMMWLCFLTHWPFHASWLGVFIENYQKCEIKERTNYLLTNQTSRSQPEGLNRTLNDTKPSQFGLEQLGPSLTALYSRVIKRFGPIIQAVRLKALSASFLATKGVNSIPGTFHTNTDSLLMTNELLTSVNKTLKICEIAFYDKDPTKLGEFLRSCDSNQLDSTISQTGSITINQLLRIMKLTPFLNPQISSWIAESLLPKMNSLENNNEQKVTERKPTSSRSSRRSHTFNMTEDHGTVLSTNLTEIENDSFRSCIAKLKETVPKKPLNQFTVNEVCHLVERIVILTNKYFKSNKMGLCQDSKSQDYLINNQNNSDLTKRLSSEESETLINDPIPPAAVNTTSDNITVSSTIRRYIDSIRKFNITGSVLDLCPLKDLEVKLNIFPIDWRLFCAFIQHLKQTECEEMLISGKSQNPNEQFTVPCKHLTQNYPRIIQSSRDKLIETDKSSVISEIRKDQLQMNTISDTSLTVKSAPLIKHYELDNELRRNERNDKADQITAMHNNRSMSMIGVNRLNDSEHIINRSIHVPRYDHTMEISKLKTKSYRHSKAMEQTINPEQLPCEKHHYTLSSQSRQTHNNDKYVKSQYESKSQYPYNIQPHLYHKPKHQKPSECKMPCDQNECNCCMHSRTIRDALTVCPAHTLPHNSHIYQQKQNHPQEAREYVIPPHLSSSTAFCNHHRKLITGNDLETGTGASATEQEESPNENLGISIHRCLKCELPFNTELNHQCIQQYIPDLYNSYKPVNSYKTAELMHHSLELPHIRSHEIKKVTQSPSMRHFNTVNDFPEINRKDSASTSLAGEIGDEVADMSQLSNYEDDNDDGFLLSGQKLEGKRIKKSSTTIIDSDAILYQHPCDCNYWYAHEQQVQHQERNQLGLIQNESIKTADYKMNSNLQEDQLNSSLDTLSTTTNSSSNDSSNTSIMNDNASKHSQLDVNSINSCDQLTSECFSDNTVNSKC